MIWKAFAKPGKQHGRQFGVIMLSVMMSVMISVLALSACTSTESKIKNAALAGAKSEFEKDLRKEISKSVSGKPHLQTNAVRILTEHAEYEVQSMDHQDKDAQALVQVKTEPDKVRAALIEIMAKLEDSKEDRFNVSDGINMIRSKLGIATGSYSSRIYKLQLRLGSEWELVQKP